MKLYIKIKDDQVHILQNMESVKSIPFKKPKNNLEGYLLDMEDKIITACIEHNARADIDDNSYHEALKLLIK